jgi:hypothetical protein
MFAWSGFDLSSTRKPLPVFDLMRFLGAKDHRFA